MINHVDWLFSYFCGSCNRRDVIDSNNIASVFMFVCVHVINVCNGGVNNLILITGCAGICQRYFEEDTKGHG